MSGHDVIAQAQSGTGKTGAFAISTLEVIDEKVNCYQAILLSPTRELAIQSRDVIQSIGSSMKNLKVKLTVGGGSMASSESDDWRHKSKDNQSAEEQVIVGTPGRIFDMITRRIISTKHIKLLILDEADEMLSDGFRSQVHQIFTCLNDTIQVVLFSATLPESVHEITSKFMRDPVNILMKTEMVTLDGISQNYVAVNNDVEKFEVLKDLFEFISSQQCIVYCNSIKRVVDLYQAMTQEDYPVSCIHGGQTKDERLSSYKEFKSGSSRVLISTNVTSRGIDVQQVSTVINFDLPNDIHNYIHRIGRSGRWGRKGVGINLITRRDVKKLKEIEEAYIFLTDYHKRRSLDEFLENRSINLNASNPFNMFDSIFNKTTFPIDNVNSKSFFKSSSYSTKMNKDGNLVTEEKVFINDNGKKVNLIN